jgi:hypothetical protein
MESGTTDGYPAFTIVARGTRPRPAQLILFAGRHGKPILRLRDVLDQSIEVLTGDDIVLYATSSRQPSPRIYSETTRGDRDLRLAGYEVYRFSGYELSEGRATNTVSEFFERLLTASKPATNRTATDPFMRTLVVKIETHTADSRASSAGRYPQAGLNGSRRRPHQPDRLRARRARAVRSSVSIKRAAKEPDCPDLGSPVSRSNRSILVSHLDPVRINCGARHLAHVACLQNDDVLVRDQVQR